MSLSRNVRMLVNIYQFKQNNISKDNQNPPLGIRFLGVQMAACRQ